MAPRWSSTDVVVAVLCMLGGSVFGALALGVVATELSKNATPPTGATGAFDGGFKIGGVVGGVLGYAVFGVIRRWRARPVRLRQISRDDARALFELRMSMRRGALLAIYVSGFLVFVLRDVSKLALPLFGALELIGLLGFWWSSRCPACSRFLSVRSMRSHECTECAARFDGGA